jgi:hypothetical protein
MTGYLVVTGIIFLLVGLRALLKPIEAVATPYELQGESTDARHYLRSGAGGVTIACGAVMVAGGILPSLEFAALLLPVTVLGGLLFGRAYSLVVDGSPGFVAWVSAVLELVGFALGVFWLWKEFG